MENARNLYFLAGIALASALLLYLYGWMLQIDPPAAAMSGGETVSQIEAGTAQIRDAADNMRLRWNLFWLGDRLLLGSGFLAALGSLVRRPN